MVMIHVLNDEALMLNRMTLESRPRHVIDKHHHNIITIIIMALLSKLQIRRHETSSGVQDHFSLSFRVPPPLIPQIARQDGKTVVRT